MNNKSFISMIVLLLLSVRIYTQSSSDYSIGKVFLINSSVLNEQRPVYVSLPAGYDQSAEKHPVLVVLDGEENFSFSSSVANFLNQSGRMPGVIVVAIPNKNRNRDLAPTVVPGQYSGGADNFISFLKNELFPFIDKNFRTANYRMLFGHSLGGTFAVYCLLNHPDMFNGYIAASPFLEYDNRYVLKDAENKLASLSNSEKMIYIALGNEPRYTDAIGLFNNLLDNAPETISHSYEQFENDDHNSIRLRAVYNGLEFLFNDWMINTEEISGGYEAIKNKYEKLSRKYGYKVTPNELTLNALGYGMLGSDKIDDAIKILSLNVELYPESSNVYDSLGEAYERNKQYKLALENYEKALELGVKENSPNRNLYENNVNRLKKQLGTEK